MNRGVFAHNSGGPSVVSVVYGPACREPEFRDTYVDVDGGGVLVEDKKSYARDVLLTRPGLIFRAGAVGFGLKVAEGDGGKHVIYLDGGLAGPGVVLENAAAAELGESVEFNKPGVVGVCGIGHVGVMVE